MISNYNSEIVIECNGLKKLNALKGKKLYLITTNPPYKQIKQYFKNLKYTVEIIPDKNLESIKKTLKKIRRSK